MEKRSEQSWPAMLKAWDKQVKCSVDICQQCGYLIHKFDKFDYFAMVDDGFSMKVDSALKMGTGLVANEALESEENIVMEDDMQYWQEMVHECF